MGDAPHDDGGLESLREMAKVSLLSMVQVDSLFSAIDAERSARVRAEAELAATRAGGVERETQYLAVVAESHKSFAAARRLERDLDAARGLLVGVRAHLAGPWRSPATDDLLARIDAIAPAQVEGLRLACSRCGAQVSRSYEPGRCHADDCEPATMGEHDQAEPWENVHGDPSATAPAEAQRWGVFIGDHRCQFGTGTEVEMRAHAAGFNAGRKPSQEQYEARPLSPIPRTGGE